jgi:hypothetical protein
VVVRRRSARARLRAICGLWLDVVAVRPGLMVGRLAGCAVMAEAVAACARAPAGPAARPGPAQPPLVTDGYYHLDRMISSAIRHSAEVGCCGTCLDARGITKEELVDDARPSTLEELTDWTLWADKAMTF